MAQKIQHRGDTKLNWEMVNPTLSEKEMVLVDTNGNGDYDQYKVGDGVRCFKDLPYHGFPAVQELTDSTVAVPSVALMKKELQKRDEHSAYWESVVGAIKSNGKNLFNKKSDQIIAGKYLNANGLLSENPIYCVTHFMSCNDAQQLYCNNVGSKSSYCCFYNKGFELMSAVEEGLCVFEVPLNASYCRFSIPLNNVNSTQVEIGTMFTGYEDFKTLINIPDKSITKEKIHNESISSEKIALNAVGYFHLEESFRNSFVEKRVGDFDNLVNAAISSYDYLEGNFSGWGSVINFKESKELIGVSIVPTSQNSSKTYLVLVEITGEISEEIYGTIENSQLVYLAKLDITNKWNTNYKNIIDIFFEVPITFDSDKRYGIYYTSKEGKCGVAIGNKVFDYESRRFYVSFGDEGVNQNLSLSNSSKRLFFDFIEGRTEMKYVPNPEFNKPGIIKSEDIESCAVSEDKCSFFTSYNLCKVEENTPFVYLSNTGNIGSNSNYFITGYMEIGAGKTYNASYLSDGGGSSNCLYDVNKEFIGSILGSSPYIVEIPLEVNGRVPYYIRCSVAIKSMINQYVFTEWELKGYAPYNRMKLKREHLPESELASDEFLLWLPQEICVATDRTIELYNSQVSWCGNLGNYHFNWSGVGKNMKRKWSCKGLVENEGLQKILTCSVYDNNMRLVEQRSCVVKFVSNKLLSEVRINPLGDSLTNSKPWIMEVVSLSDFKIKFTGTRNPSGEVGGLSHEGRSGGVASFFLGNNEYTYEGNGKDGLDGRDKRYNPYWNPDSGEFDLNYYRANYEIAFDAIQVFFGTNGANLNPSNTINGVKALIEEIRRYEPTMKVFVVNTLFRGTQDGIANGGATDGYVNNPSWKLQEDRKVFNLQVELTEALKDYENVHFIPISVTHDSEYNFGAIETSVNPRALQKEYLPYEATHPQLQGYQQFADIMFSTYCAYLKK